jgi:tetratricopeptide (TPR) repeat protein
MVSILSLWGELKRPLWALAIFQNLTSNGYDVFCDYSGIASGDFEGVILENITSRAHSLVLLTPSALERCGDPADWLRREIETALESRRNIVPLMLEGFDFSTPAIDNQLTGKLAGLKRYNALRIPSEYFLEAMGRLRERFLNVPLKAVLHPASQFARLAATEQRAEVVMAPAVAEEELTAQQWFERGVEATNHDEELRFYSHAIRLEPDFPEAFNNRAIARNAKGDREGALEDYNEAIRLKPDYADAFNNRGIARNAKGDREGALSDYTEAIRLKPDYPEALYNRAIARKAAGDLEGALSDYTEAIRLKPDDAEAFNNRGAARQAAGDREGALSDYTEAIRLKPDDAEAFNNRGIVHKAAGDVKGALSDYNEAIRLRPDYAESFKNRGNARKGAGDLKGALEDYDEAIRLKPDYADAFYNRAGIWAGKADYKAGIADFWKYLELGGGLRDGDQGDVEEKIRELEKKLGA